MKLRNNLVAVQTTTALIGQRVNTGKLVVCGPSVHPFIEELRDHTVIFKSVELKVDVIHEIDSVAYLIFNEDQILGAVD